MILKLATASMLAIALVTTASATDTAREQKLQQAIDLMETRGDIVKAMSMFEDVARSTDHELASRALLYLGSAQERLGEDKARATYDRITKEFSDQTETVEAARQRLAAIGNGSQMLKTTKLTVPGNGNSEANVSRDGQWFGGTDWKTGDLVLENIITGEVRRLVHGGMQKTTESWGEFPVLSPDLRQVAFLWFGDPESSGSGQLRVMPNEAGGKPRALVSANRNQYPLGWSLDGKSILASIDKLSVGARNASERTGFDLAWVSVSDGTVRVIKTLEPWRSDGENCVCAALSPDAKFIAYSAPVQQGSKGKSIHVLSADGKTDVEVVTGDTNESPVWTPDGNTILFSSNKSGSFGLWAVPVKDGKRSGILSIVKPEMGRTQAIGMSVSGTYYYRYQSALDQVFIAELRPDGARTGGAQIQPSESFVGIVPVWSRDGKWLAFKRSNPRSTANEYELVVHSMENGSEWIFAPPQTGNGRPRWFKDGRLQANRTVQFSVATGQPKETNAAILPPGELSPDDNWLYRTANRDPQNNTSPTEGVELVDAASGSRKNMFMVPGALALALSPDGKTLAVVTRPGDEGPRRLVRIAVDGTGMRELYSTGIPAGVNRIAWTRDSRSILFVQSDTGGTPRIMRISADGGTPEFTGLSVPGLSAFDLSPDGSHIAYSAKPSISEIWKMDNLTVALKSGR